MPYNYEPIAIVDEETYDAAMWNEYEARHLNDNMLMPDFDEVDEKAWDEAMEDLRDDEDYLDSYEQMIEAMECPDIKFYEDTPEDVRLVIESINCMLNRNGHKLSEPIVMEVSRKVYKNGKSDRVEEVVYRDGKLWTQVYLMELDCWEQRCLEAYEKSALDKLLNAIINDLF